MKIMNQSLMSLLGLTLLAAPQAQSQSENTLRVFTAIEVEYDTQPGQSYQLQGSIDLESWVDIGLPVLGHGRTVQQVFSTRGGENVDYASYRLLIEEGPMDGLAPWTFAGLTLNLDDEIGGDLMEFTTEDTGVDLGDDPDPFSYIFTRLNEDQVSVEIISVNSGDGARKDVYVFTFTAPGMGSWVRDEFRDGRLKDRDQGIFRIVDGTIPMGGGDQENVPTEPPASFAGLVYLFDTGETPDRLEFFTESTGVEYENNPRPDDDEPNKVFIYTYALLDETHATLVIELPNNRRDEYDLTFTEGAQGSFLRREFRDGVLDDIDTGVFSPSSSAPVGDPSGNAGDGEGQAPSTPLGLTFTMQSGDIPERLVFQSVTGGVEFDDSAPSQFTYLYQATGETTVELEVRFKPDKWDEYDLTFTHAQGGIFVRREFDDDRLKDTDGGSFTFAATN